MCATSQCDKRCLRSTTWGSDAASQPQTVADYLACTGLRPIPEEFFMSETFDDKNRIDNGRLTRADERLTTADLVNRSRPAAVYPDQDVTEPGMCDDAPSMPEEEISEEAAAMPEADIEEAGSVRSDRGTLDYGRSDRFPGDSVRGARNGQATEVAGEPAQVNPLFAQDELRGFRSHWDAVQTSFVDEPRTAVEQADSLVANVVKRIAEQFSVEREQLEKQWDRGEDVNTEDLRQALKRYRAFFDRLLAF